MSLKLTLAALSKRKFAIKDLRAATYTEYFMYQVCSIFDMEDDPILHRLGTHLNSHSVVQWAVANLHHKWGWAASTRSHKKYAAYSDDDIVADIQVSLLLGIDDRKEAMLFRLSHPDAWHIKPDQLRSELKKHTDIIV